MTLPNREGWVNWPLSEIPPSGPFPQFTKFEAAALEDIASRYGEKAELFREHVAAAKVVDRIHTGVGFYTRIVVDRAICRPLENYDINPAMLKGGGTFEVTGVRYGVCFILWGKDGYLQDIEGVTCGDDNLNEFALDQLVCGEFLG